MSGSLLRTLGIILIVAALDLTPPSFSVEWWFLIASAVMLGSSAANPSRKVESA